MPTFHVFVSADKPEREHYVPSIRVMQVQCGGTTNETYEHVCSGANRRLEKTQRMGGKIIMGMHRQNLSAERRI